MTRIRVHEVAKELGAESKQVISWLRDLGYFVKSASSVVTPEARKALTDALMDGRLQRDRGERPPAPQRFRRSRPPQPATWNPPPENRKLLDASAIFDVPVESLKPARDQRRQLRRPEPSKPLDEWTRRLFSEEEKRVWLRAGLGEENARIAEDCIRANISPEDLRLRVDGVTVVGRLRGGESVASVQSRIREHKGRQAG